MKHKLSKIVTIFSVFIFFLFVVPSCLMPKSVEHNANKSGNLVELYKQQSKEVKELKAQNEKLRKLNTELQAEVEQLKKGK